MNIKYFIGFAALITTTSFAAAQSICSVKKGGWEVIKSVGYDLKTREAKVTDSSGKTHMGKVTAVRKHDNGVKVNIAANLDDQTLGILEAEVMVFPSGEGMHRIIGVSYVSVDGRRQLTHVLANSEVTCLSI